MGFEPAYETFRWSGRIDGRTSTDIVASTADLLPAISAFDRNCFPSERGAFLAEWLKPPRIVRLDFRNGRVCGYGVARQCHEGSKIGPLFAETTDQAMRLLEACSAAAGEETLHIDIPASQAEFSSLLAERGFSKGFTTARMYRGPAPVVAMQGVFGITTLELG